MKIVDKYELAKCSYGTPFYHLDCCGNDNEYFQITEGLKILTSNTHYTLYDDEDRFLILDKSEFKILLDDLQNYYSMMKE